MTDKAKCLGITIDSKILRGPHIISIMKKPTNIMYQYGSTNRVNTTSHSLVYYELGRLPLYILRKLRIIKYWGKLKNSEDCILKSCLEERINLNNNWVINIKTELCKLGLTYIWDEVYIDKRLCIIIEHRFYDVYRQ